MNQSEVSRLERRRDVRLSTLYRYVHAIGGRLRTFATWPDGSQRSEIVVCDWTSEEPGDSAL